MKQIEDNLEEILEVLDGDGVPNIQWVRNKIADTLKQVKNNSVLGAVSDCDCLETERVEEDGELYCLKCGSSWQ